MSVVIPMEHDEHAAVQALLPWHAKGRLAGDEAERVQRHLLHCAACRSELAAEQPLQTLMNLAGSQPEVGDVEAGLARLHARMGPARPKAAAPRWTSWALGLQGAACALLLGLWLHERQTEPAYEGLSAPGTAPVVADALVMFKPDTSERAVRELLQAEKASVVAGPTETGAWLLRIDARGLAELRTAPVVQMAEPLQPGPAQ
jgi:anti-sigma factor RsiW